MSNPCWGPRHSLFPSLCIGDNHGGCFRMYRSKCISMYLTEDVCSGDILSFKLISYTEVCITGLCGLR